MSTPESTSDGKSQEQLPDLYRLLGLTPLEADTAKIQRGLVAMQKKAEAAQASDPKLAIRAAKVVALGKKNLLDADRKSAYDRVWTKTYAAADAAQPSKTTLTPHSKTPADKLPVATPATSDFSVATASVATVQVAAAAATEANVAELPTQEIQSKTPELEWDLDELESMLPAEDPRAPFDLGGFLRYSASMPETNPIADYDKLQSFLGGASTATIDAPASISATELLPEYSRLSTARAHAESDEADDSLQEQFSAPKKAFTNARSPVLPGAPGEIAKQIRRKRSRAMLLSVGSIAGAMVLVFGVMFYLVSKETNSKIDATELAQTPQNKVKPKADSNAAVSPSEPDTSVPMQGSGLPKVGGLDGNDAQPKPNMMEGMAAEPASTQPDAPSPATPTTPAAPMTNEPTSVPAATVPAATPPAETPPAETPPAATPPAETMPPTPGTEPVAGTQPEMPPADAVLTTAEKAAWNRAMKETLKTLGAQNFKLVNEQLTASGTSAKTQLQREQLKRLTTVAKLAEEYHGFLVDAVGSLGPAETFKIGGSSEASFVEGSENAVSLKIRGRAITFAFTELQIGVANGLVDLKMDVEHPRSLARKSAFALVHPKTNGLALKAAREQMIVAAAAGAVETDLPNVFDEDYTLK